MAASPFPASAFSAPVLAAINHVLDQADWARLKLQPFAGRSIRTPFCRLRLITQKQFMVF
jgi:ubiquinone biosynthesis protein UbiJ